VPRRSPPPIPGLVERTEPLAPGQAHVDPQDPRGHRERPGTDVWSWQMQTFVWTAPLLALVTVVLAVERGSWLPLVSGAIFLLAAVAAQRTRDRYDRSRRGRRDLLRVSGGMLLALVLLLGGIPFLAP
jgi:hypothetical protein